MSIGEFIKKRRVGLRYSQRQVALYSGLSNATISRIENGNVIPDGDTLKKLAFALKMKPERLFEALGYLEKPDTSQKSNVTNIPVLGHIAAGIPMEAIEDIYDYEEIPAEWVKNGAEFFGLKIKGGSMEPRIQENDVVIIRKQPDVESGEMAAVRINRQDVTVKKLVKHDSGVSLVSYNAAYEPMFYTNDEVISLPVEIIGKVVELRGKF
jgi:repressor LexA